MNKLHIVSPANLQGTDYVIGDLHGCIDAFNRALEEIKFDPAIDRMFSVGDLVDRGPDSEACANLINEPWFFAVRGNHEQMAIEFGNPDYRFSDYRMDIGTYSYNGGAWFIALPSSMDKYYKELFSTLPYVRTVMLDDTRKVGIIHASPVLKDFSELTFKLDAVKNAASPELLTSLMWDRSHIRYALQNPESVDDISGVERIFLGHTPVVEPQHLGNTIYIDTGCVFKKSLTVYRLDGTMATQVPYETPPEASV